MINILKNKGDLSMADEKKSSGGTYLIQKRKSDGKWEVKVTGGERAIKLFDTKAEAVEFTKGRAERNDRAVLARASKGAHSGKFQK